MSVEVINRKKHEEFLPRALIGVGEHGEIDKHPIL